MRPRRQSKALRSVSRHRFICIELSMGVCLTVFSSVAQAQSTNSPFVDFPRPETGRRELVRTDSKLVRITPTLSQILLNIALVSKAKAATPAPEPPTLFYFSPPQTMKRELVRADSKVLRITPTLGQIEFNISLASTAKAAALASVPPTHFDFSPPEIVRREMVRAAP